MAVGKSGYLDVTVMPQSVGKVRVYWREDYDPEQNYSTITVTDVQGYLWHRTGWTYVSASLTAGSVTVLPNTAGSWMFSANADTTLRSVVSGSDWQQGFVPVTSAPIYHNDDGTKTVTLTLTLHDVTTPSVGFDGTNNQIASQVITLTEIPRASGVTAMSGTIGSPVTVSVTRANAAFTHTLTYALGSASGMIAERTASTGISWTPPMELCSEIPNGERAVCTITCHTYSGSTLIGTKTADVTLTVPDSVGLRVTEGWAMAAPYNAGTAAQGLEIYVQGYSVAQVTFDEAKIDKTAAYGSEIASFSVRCGDRTDTDTYRTELLSASGDTEILCTVTDTRGRTVTETLTVPVLPYAKPTLSGIEIFRCDSDGAANDGGASLRVTAECGFSELEGHNSASVQAAYRSMNGSYGEAVTLESGTAAVLWAGELSPRQTYELRLTAVDALGNAAVYTVIIPTDDAFFHGRQGGKGAAFGKYAEEDDLLEVAWNIRGKKNLDVEGAVTVGGKSLASLIAAAADPLQYMPVGYVYISSDSTSPAALFGGTWERLTDRVILGAGGSYAVDSKGGAATHTLTINELPSHRHSLFAHAFGWGDSGGNVNIQNATAASGATSGNRLYTMQNQWNYTQYSGGNGAAHNNLPPYVAKYIWERVE